MGMTGGADNMVSEEGVDAEDIEIDPGISSAGNTVVGENIGEQAEQDQDQDDGPGIPEPSYIPLYTIPAGTVLYHGSKTKETFDPQKITLGDDTLAAFFTPNKRFAADYISGCVGEETGYIHMFKVRIPITSIYVISSHNKKDVWDISQLETKFCKGTEYGRLNGVGFFVKDDFSNKFIEQIDTPESEELKSTETAQVAGGIPIASEFAICDPSSFLDYISTQRCQSARNLSQPYNFAV